MLSPNAQGQRKGPINVHAVLSYSHLLLSIGLLKILILPGMPDKDCCIRFQRNRIETIPRNAAHCLNDSNTQIVTFEKSGAMTCSQRARPTLDIRTQQKP